jgi:hypothetical protein
MKVISYIYYKRLKILIDRFKGNKVEEEEEEGIEGIKEGREEEEEEEEEDKDKVEEEVKP